MSKLPDDDEQLQGWGSFKKSVGLNKLGTRNAIKTNVKAAVALMVPTKKNLKSTAASAGKSRLANTAMRIGANIAAPGSGELISNLNTAEAAKVEAKKQAAQLDAQLVAAEAEAAKAATEAGTAQATQAATQAAQQSKARRTLAKVAGGLGLLALAGYVIKNRSARHGTAA